MRIEYTLEGKHHAMGKSALPFHFAAALVQDKRAMQCFAHMGDEEREAILQRARCATSQADMRLLVGSLSSGIDATEHDRAFS